MSLLNSIVSFLSHCWIFICIVCIILWIIRLNIICISCVGWIVSLFVVIFIISLNTSCISHMSSLSALLPVIRFYAIIIFPPSFHRLIKPIITTMLIKCKIYYSYSFYYFLIFYYLICSKIYLYNSSIAVIYNKRPTYGSLLSIPWMIRIESKNV